MGFAVSLFAPAEWFLLALWFAAIFSPLVYAVKTRTSVAMGITVSVLLGAVVQVLWSMFFSYGWVQYWVWSDFVLVPVRLAWASDSDSLCFGHALVCCGFC